MCGLGRKKGQVRRGARYTQGHATRSEAAIVAHFDATPKASVLEPALTKAGDLFFGVAVAVRSEIRRRRCDTTLLLSLALKIVLFFTK